MAEITTKAQKSAEHMLLEANMASDGTVGGVNPHSSPEPGLIFGLTIGLRGRFFVQPALLFEPGPVPRLPGPQGPENRQKNRGRIYHFILPKVSPRKVLESARFAAQGASSVARPSTGVGGCAASTASR